MPLIDELHDKGESTGCVRPLKLVKCNRLNMPMKGHLLKNSVEGERFKKKSKPTQIMMFEMN